QAGFRAEGEESGGGEVERVVNLVNDAGAESAQGGQLFGLHQLGFGLLELLDGRLERLVLTVERSLILVGLDEVFHPDMKFGGGKGLRQAVVRASVERAPFG